MKVLVFGTSANPPCGMGGHMGLVEHFAQEFDQVWVLPVYQHIYSSKQHLESFDHRFAMLEIARKAIPHGDRVRIQTTEKDVWMKALEDKSVDPSSIRIGTVDIVAHLQATYPDIKFSMLLGADTFMDLLKGKWKGGLQLLDMLSLVVLPRAGVELDRSHPNVTFVHVPTLDDSSSTKARRSRADAEAVVLPSVLEYIKTHRLYAFAE
ncbi:hypothetical protein LEN26_006451 [Aphanomyces euteiches]|nr:hypothetical protein AeMF1_010061 [Aphanomyces euteiches]KAH9135364.1 hypothetical protein LEN26_006451 [Aphanomyces euteiches]KAH9194023.1 hypothetical protein AeNC1_003995 [Aphanomyces euteiches]